MSSADAVAFLDLANGDATRPAVVATADGSSPRAMWKAVLQKVPVTGTGTAEVTIGLRRPGWTAGKTIEATVAQAPLFWGSEGALRVPQEDQLAQTQADLRELASRVESLARSIETIAWARAVPEFHETPPPSVIIADALAAADEPQHLAELLDLIADEHLECPMEIVEAARKGLSSVDSSLRAASARVLSVTDPDFARETLPGAIAAESDPFAVAVLRGALRSLK